MKSHSVVIAMKAGALSLSYPSPRVAVGREGRSEAEARVGGFVSRTPTPMLSRRRFASPGSLAIAEASLRRFLKTAAPGGLCLPRGRDKRPRLRGEV